MSTVSTPTNSISTRRLSVVPSEEDQIRIRGIGSFIDRRALSLHSTLEAVAGTKGAELVEELVGALSTAWPDPVLVTRLVGEAHDLLADASYEHLDRVSYQTSARHLHERVSWFGARLSDLAS